ncbi:unnamed protein product [Amoebophrya sp. A120]|nr:unnamed protein product [Amoebophrya sp. A120]|eukprot:GSA120T00000947001.1
MQRRPMCFTTFLRAEPLYDIHTNVFLFFNSIFHFQKVLKLKHDQIDDALVVAMHFA